MKILYLTTVDTVPSQEGEEKIERALQKQKSGEEKRDDYGRTKNWYIENEFKVPEHFFEDEESEIDEDGNIHLLPEEMEYSFSDYILRLDYFLDATDDEEIGSIVSTTTGKYIHVEETAEQINLYISYLNLSWFERLKISVSNLFSRKKNNK